MRNEAWVAEFSIRAALEWCDEVCVLLHACTDDTAAIVDRLRVETGRVTMAMEPDPAPREQDHRQRLLEMGRRAGGSHFAIVDADEVLAANWLPGIRIRIERLTPGELLCAPWVDLWRGLDQYRSDRCGTVPLAFCDALHLEHRNDADGYPLNVRAPRPLRVRSAQHAPHGGGLMHLQRVSWRRAVARQARYKMQELLLWPGHRGGVAEIERRHAKSIDECGVRLAQVPASWWAYPVDRALIRPDLEPWEEGAVCAMLAEHGAARFKGLDVELGA